MSKDVAVLGVGMHPWGKWGQSFVGYGVKAAQDALKDAGVAARHAGEIEDDGVALVAADGQLAEDRIDPPEATAAPK